METRAAIAAVVMLGLLACGGCGSEAEQLPELPKGPEPSTPAPVVETRPESVPLGQSTRQTQSAIGGAYRSSLARIDNYAITHQLNLYQAEHGHYPRSNEEFHEKFMKGYQIPYPEMEEGYELVYDPEENAIYQKLIKEPEEMEADPAADSSPDGAATNEQPPGESPAAVEQADPPTES